MGAATAYFPEYLKAKFAAGLIFKMLGGMFGILDKLFEKFRWTDYWQFEQERIETWES